RQVTWTGNDRLWDCAPGAVLTVVQGFVTPNIFGFNGGVTPDIAMVLGTYRIVAANFTNSIADYIDVSGNRVTGSNADNGGPGVDFNLGAGAGGTVPCNIEVCELWIFNTTPTALQFAQLRAYAVARYGPTVVTRPMALSRSPILLGALG